MADLLKTIRIRVYHVPAMERPMDGPWLGIQAYEPIHLPVADVIGLYEAIGRWLEENAPKSSSPEVLATLKCDTHGKRPWLGHVVCAKDAGGCGRVYQTQTPGAPNHAPINCPCGKLLMPGTFVGHPIEDFTARAICYDCYRFACRNPGAPG